MDIFFFPVKCYSLLLNLSAQNTHIATENHFATRQWGFYMAGDATPGMQISPCFCSFNSSGLGRLRRHSQLRGEQENRAEDEWGTGFWPVSIRRRFVWISRRFQPSTWRPSAKEHPPPLATFHNTGTQYGYSGNQIFFESDSKRRLDEWGEVVVAESQKTSHSRLRPGDAKKRKPAFQTDFNRPLPHLCIAETLQYNVSL